MDTLEIKEAMISPVTAEIGNHVNSTLYCPALALFRVMRRDTVLDSNLVEPAANMEQTICTYKGEV
jgi:hypothetical protein